MNKNNTGYRNTGYWNTGNRNAGDGNTGNGNTGYRNTGDRNAGDRNAGYWNTGNWNTGNRNAGDGNTGNGNTGYRNTGDRNTGDRNAGDRNAGHWNTGDRNTGNWNVGDGNTGNWNVGDGNTGHLNTTEPKVRIFNKETDVKLEEMEFPSFFYFKLTDWVNESEMTEKEKEENDQYRVTGGYLKTYDYQEAWRNSWNEADDADRRKVLALPNWDNEVFKEITGIDVEKELGIAAQTNEPKDEIVIDGVTYRRVVGR